MIDWDAICQRCGLCCFEKTIDQKGTVTTTKTACRYLDIVDRHCRVYHKRFSVGEGCVQLTPDVVRKADWLPMECAYRKALRRANP